MRRSVLMTRLVTRSGRVGLTRMWTRLAGAGSALGVADDPAHGVAGGDRAGADELLAGLQRDVGDLARRGIDLIERAGRERIDLHGVDVAVAHRLHAGGGIGLVDALLRIRRPPACDLPPGIGFSWPGSGSGFGSSTTSTGFGGSARSTAGSADRRRQISGGLSLCEQPRARQPTASRMRTRITEDMRVARAGDAAFMERRRHCPSSFDQLMALT